MEMIKIERSSDRNGIIHLDIPTKYSNCNTELIIIIDKKKELNKESRQYDFSNIAGKLSWRGDAVKEQRVIRNEW